MTIPRHLLVLASTLSLVASAHAAMTLQLAVDVHVEPAAENKNVPADQHFTLEVVLGGDYFAVKSGKDTVWYDFAKRTRTAVDTAANRRVDYSLYDTVGFRVMELQNRELLDKALAAAHLEQALAAQLDNEHTLAVQDKPSAPLQVEVNDTGTVFKSDSAVLFTLSRQATEVSPSDARLFAQFMRYTFGGHPQILESLAGSQSIPSTFTLITHDIGRTTRHVVVESIRPDTGAPIDTAAVPVREASATQDLIDRALDRAAAFSPEDLAAAKRRSIGELASAFADGRAVDAYLGMIEWTLMTGESVPPLTPEQKSLLQADDTVRKLNLALPARTKEELTQAVAVLADVKPLAVRKSYVLGIFEANDLARLGDRMKARRLFLDALTANGQLAGVYKDLGDTLFIEYDMPRAWRCWDTGRKIAPGFANFGPVRQLEQSLSARHPEYFAH